MSPINRHKYKYFHSTVQRANDRRQKFHFCRLPFDVRPRNVKLNLSKDVWEPRENIRRINSTADLLLYKIVRLCYDLGTLEIFY